MSIKLDLLDIISLCNILLADNNHFLLIKATLWFLRSEFDTKIFDFDFSNIMKICNGRQYLFSILLLNKLAAPKKSTFLKKKNLNKKKTIKFLKFSFKDLANTTNSCKSYSYKNILKCDALF